MKKQKKMGLRGFHWADPLTVTDVSTDNQNGLTVEFDEEEGECDMQP